MKPKNKEIFMKRLLSVVIACLGVAFMVTGQAQARIPDQYTELRTTSVLTTSDALSTTFTIPNNVKALHFYIDFTKGSLTSVDFAPAAAMSGNPQASDYFKAVDFVTNLTASGKVHIRVPAERFGAATYAGIFAKGIGTTTSSSAYIAAKYEY